MTDPVCAGLKEYTYAEHRFRFAAWAAGAAKPVNRQPDISFGGDDCQDILRATGFPYEIAEKGTERLPDPDEFDMQHRAWCEKVHKEAKERLGIDLSYGQSAKLINVFIKALMPADIESLPDGEEKAKWYAVHPPIDREVLTGMKEKRFGYRYKDIWVTLPGTNGKPYNIPSRQKFKYEHYRKVICMIRCWLSECGYEDPLPLWKIEWFFKLNP